MTDVLALRAIVDELVEAGVTDVVVCPGSRSTPLALATRAHPGLRVRVLLDERSAGFFALGLARASRRPVAVVVTSGTAVANLLPAVVEASLARVPLVLLTADRPPELRDRGAPQTIDQVRHLRRPRPLVRRAAAARRGAGDAAARPLGHRAGRRDGARRSGRAGPPQHPVPRAAHPGRRARAARRAEAEGGAGVGGRSRRSSPGDRRSPPTDLADLADQLASVERGLIVAGPQDDPDLPAALARLAAATGYPDRRRSAVRRPLRAARPLARRCATRDHLVRPGPWRDAHLPELVIRFGATPTSKPMLTLLGRARCRPRSSSMATAAGASRRSSRRRSSTPTRRGHGRALAAALEGARRRPADARRRAWATAWLDADRAADAALDDLARGRGGARRAVRGPAVRAPRRAPARRRAPVGRQQHAGPRPRRLAAGQRPRHPAAVEPRRERHRRRRLDRARRGGRRRRARSSLVVGDVSFLHDLNALVAARLHGLSATIVLIDNDGGGIFSFLPQATTDAPEVGLPEHYEELFGTPHGIDFGPIVTALGGEYRRGRSGRRARSARRPRSAGRASGS